MKQEVEMIYVTTMTRVDVTGACQPYVNWAFLEGMYPRLRAVKLTSFGYVFDHPMGLSVADRERPTPFPSPKNFPISDERTDR